MGAWIFAPKYAFVNPYFLITSYLSKSLEFLYLSLFSLISILSLSSLWGFSFLHELHFCFKWKTFHAVSCYMCGASKKFSTVWRKNRVETWICSIIFQRKFENNCKEMISMTNICSMSCNQKIVLEAYHIMPAGFVMKHCKNVFVKNAFTKISPVLVLR